METRNLKTILAPDTFIKMLTIYNKDRQRLDFFNPFEVQLDLLDKLIKYDRIIIVKARQMGISTMVRAWFFYQAFYDLEPRSYGVIAHNKEASNNIASMDRVFHDNLPRHYHRKFSKENISEMIFENTGASLRAFTAASKHGTRSFQLDGVHLSEFAFYEDQSEFLATLTATVGGGQIIIESTPNVLGDRFSDLVFQNLTSEDPEWLVLFFPWYSHPTYTQEPPLHFQLRPAEELIKNELNLTNGQIYWRRKQIATLGKEKFIREYPASIDEAFKYTGQPYFDSVALDRIEPVANPKGKYKKYCNVDPDAEYIIGVDTASGVGKDYSAISVVDVHTRQVVAQWWDNETEPIKFTDILYDMGWEWNNAKIIVEANNTGQVILWKLKDHGYNRIWKNKKGKHFFTNNKTRPILFENLRDIISDNLLFKLNKEVIKQLETIYYSNNKPVHPKGKHDDIVFSMALAYYAIKDVPLNLDSYNRGSGLSPIDEWKKKKALKESTRSLPWNIKDGDGKGAY